MKVLLSTVLAGLAFSAVSFAKDLQMSDLPQPVQDSIRREAGSEKVDDLKSVVMNGERHFLAEIDRPGEHNDRILHLLPSGQVVQIDDEMNFKDTPIEVQNAVRGLVPTGGKVDDVKKEAAGGNVVFSLEIDRPVANDLKLKVSPSGQILEQREEKD